MPNVGAKLRRARFQLASSLSFWSRNLASGSGRPAPEMSPAIGGSRALFGARTFSVICARSCSRRRRTRASVSSWAASRSVSVENARAKSASPTLSDEEAASTAWPNTRRGSSGH
eukprot:7193242-Karenia_brevis.AAC.1